MVLLSSETVKIVKPRYALDCLNKSKFDIIVVPALKKDLVESVCKNVNLTDDDIKNVLEKNQVNK